MKHNSRRRSPRATSAPSGRACAATDRWEFSHTSESFFPLGSGENLRGVNVRLADGSLRFVPL